MATYSYDGQDLKDIETNTVNGMDAAIEAYEELVRLSGETGVLGDAGTKLQEVLAGTQETMNNIKQSATSMKDGVDEKKKYEAETGSQVMDALNMGR